jgi:hypothetical protein
MIKVEKPKKWKENGRKYAMLITYKSIALKKYLNIISFN